MRAKDVLHPPIGDTESHASEVGRYLQDIDHRVGRANEYIVFAHLYHLAIDVHLQATFLAGGYHVHLQAHRIRIG